MAKKVKLLKVLLLLYPDLRQVSGHRFHSRNTQVGNSVHVTLIYFIRKISMNYTATDEVQRLIISNLNHSVNVHFHDIYGNSLF